MVLFAITYPNEEGKQHSVLARQVATSYYSLWRLFGVDGIQSPAHKALWAGVQHIRVLVWMFVTFGEWHNILVRRTGSFPHFMNHLFELSLLEAEFRSVAQAQASAFWGSLIPFMQLCLSGNFLDLVRYPMLMISILRHLFMKYHFDIHLWQHLVLASMDSIHTVTHTIGYNQNWFGFYLADMLVGWTVTGLCCIVKRKPLLGFSPLRFLFAESLCTFQR